MQASRSLDVRVRQRNPDARGLASTVRLLDRPLPWTRMRTVYRLLGLVRCYGPGPVEAACARALELDVVDVTKIARMLEQASERAPAAAAAKVVGGPARFARDVGEFAVNGEVTR